MRTSLLLSLTVVLSTCNQACAQSSLMSPAWIEVTCPAEAALTIQGQLMRSSGPWRIFASPPLPAGRVFTYEVRATLRGRVLSVRHVDIEAGKTSYVTIDHNDAVANYGVDVERLRKSMRPGQGDATGEEQRPVPGDDKLPAPNRRRLTVIGSDAERKQAREELAGPLRGAAAHYVVQDYAPEHWAVAKAGFVTTGHPTIYGQEPDGRVLFRQDDLSGLQRNLEAVRKPSPDYQPDRDPDHRKTPALPGWETLLPLGSLLVAAWFLWKSR
jgi:uncharacterized protein (TIGR03000 family)